MLGDNDYPLTLSKRFVESTAPFPTGFLKTTKCTRQLVYPALPIPTKIKKTVLYRHNNIVFSCSSAKTTKCTRQLVYLALPIPIKTNSSLQIQQHNLLLPLTTAETTSPAPHYIADITSPTMMLRSAKTRQPALPIPIKKQKQFSTDTTT